MSKDRLLVSFGIGAFGLALFGGLLALRLFFSAQLGWPVPDTVAAGRRVWMAVVGGLVFVAAGYATAVVAAALPAVIMRVAGRWSSREALRFAFAFSPPASGDRELKVERRSQK